jgi:YHS domain-containing protein
MTMMAGRGQRKRSWRGPARALVFLAGLVVGHALAVTNDALVSDSRSGLAISGYDPVAYFTDADARLGLSTLEHGYGGVVWRFRNEGNRAAFVEAPAVYMPRYGGYDPVAVARGVAVAGHPLVWLVVGQRLYLFADAKARTAFAADPQHYIAEADRNWPDVRGEFAR